MCNCYVAKQDIAEQFDIDFDEYFDASLQQLGEARDAELVNVSDDTITVTDRGRLFVRNICMAFDRYREAKEDSSPMFSQTV